MRLNEYIQLGEKMQRQAIQVSIKELRELADKLYKEKEESKLFISITQKWQINIINKSKCSDTWEFEHIK